MMIQLCKAQNLLDMKIIIIVQILIEVQENKNG